MRGCGAQAPAQRGDQRAARGRRRSRVQRGALRRRLTTARRKERRPTHGGSRPRMERTERSEGAPSEGA